MNYANLTKQELLDLVTEQQTLKDAVEVKDKEIKRLNERVLELQKAVEQMVTQDDLNKTIKKIEEERNKATDIANRYIQAHRDLMRMIKVDIDVAISHEELLSEKLK